MRVLPGLRAVGHHAASDGRARSENVHVGPICSCTEDRESGIHFKKNEIKGHTSRRIDPRRTEHKTYSDYKSRLILSSHKNYLLTEIRILQEVSYDLERNLSGPQQTPSCFSCIVTLEGLPRVVLFYIQPIIQEILFSNIFGFVS